MSEWYFASPFWPENAQTFFSALASGEEPKVQVVGRSPVLHDGMSPQTDLTGFGGSDLFGDCEGMLLTISTQDGISPWQERAGSERNPYQESGLTPRSPSTGENKGT